jgi:DNA/RNA-binding domain of Phe-tRNA-synthetase-like protein
MEPLPFKVEKLIDGWALFWAQLVMTSGDQDRLDALRTEVAESVRSRFELVSLASDPTVSGLRKLFKAVRCDPSRYRPSSEALLRRLLKGGEIPAIHPLVDLNNCLSAELAVPCCVMSEGTFEPPLIWRAGREGESYESLRGPFNLEKKPLLLDTLGPLDAPITGSQRVKVTSQTRSAWLVAYLPVSAVTPELAEEKLTRLVGRAPVAEILLAAAC